MSSSPSLPWSSSSSSPIGLCSEHPRCDGGCHFLGYHTYTPERSEETVEETIRGGGLPEVIVIPDSDDVASPEIVVIPDVPDVVDVPDASNEVASPEIIVIPDSPDD